MKTKNRSPFLWLSVLIPLAFAALTLTALINSNLIYSYLGSYTNVALFIFPVLCVASAAVYLALLCKKKDMLCLIYSAISVIALVAAFMLSSNASNAKIQGDFLKHESAFNKTVAELSECGGINISLENEELFNVVPTKKVDVISTGNSSIVLFYTIDTSNRFECYAYLPGGNYPIAWDMNLTEWSNPLDINSEWYYICVYK